MPDLSNKKYIEKKSFTIKSLNGLVDIVVSDIVRAGIVVYKNLIDDADGQIPKKSKIDPMVFRGNLANTVLYDVSDPAHVIFKIVGENMKSHFKTNPVGKCYLDFVPEIRRSHALSAFRFCAEIPCAMLSRTRQVFESGLSRYCEAVGFPLMGETSPGFATHLLFVDSPVTLGQNSELDESPFRFAHLLERHFIDLGHGVPDTFTDLIQDGVANPFQNAQARLSAPG
jgi:hypothetical protein